MRDWLRSEVFTVREVMLASFLGTMLAGCVLLAGAWGLVTMKLGDVDRILDKSFVLVDEIDHVADKLQAINHEAGEEARSTIDEAGDKLQETIRVWKNE